MLGDVLCHGKWCRSMSFSDHDIDRLTTEQRDRTTPRCRASCRETTRCHMVPRNRATPRRLADTPRDATSCRGTVPHYVVHWDRVTPRCHANDPTTQRCAEGSCNFTLCRDHALLCRRASCRESARYYFVQKDRAAPCLADRWNNSTSYRGTMQVRETTWFHVVQRGRTTPRRCVDRLHDILLYRGSVQHYMVQRDRTMPRRRETSQRHVVCRDHRTARCVEKLHDATSYKGTAWCHVVQRYCAMPHHAEGLCDTTSTDRPTGTLDWRWGDYNYPHQPWRGTLGTGKPTLNMPSVIRSLVKTKEIM